ncbi:MAG: NAD(+)/NADH kinase [Muribaculaceae bacterium]|nr:NAD(+)/NADH kinase [Muribaculaceae bacterium]
MRIAVFAISFSSMERALEALDFMMQPGVVAADTTVAALAEVGVTIARDVEMITTPDDIDFIVSLGGDGTFLRAAAWSGASGVPVAGVNMGHLGYLAAFTPGELHALPRLLAEGRYQLQRRSLLEVRFPDRVPLPDGFWPYALNEVAFLRLATASMIDVMVEIDGRRLATYSGDGLIVSTPTGSTGYNLSAGGPLIQPGVEAWSISPIAPHALTMRPLVVSDRSVLSIKTMSRTPMFRFSLDSRTVSLPAKTRIEVRKAPFWINVVLREGRTFAEALRDKLHWGVGNNE